MDQARKLAGEILTKITKEGAYSGAALDAALFSVKLDARDKGFVTELVYGTLTRLYTIDRILQTYSKVKLTKMEDVVLAQLRLAIYQIRFLDRVPAHAAVSEAVTIVRKKSPRAAGFVNGTLRAILREDQPIRFAREVDRLAFAMSLKPELTAHFQTEYPDRAEAILGELLQPRGLSIRVNRQKISVAAYRALLDGAGIPWRAGWFSEAFLYLERQGALRDLPGFREGYFSVQNEAAALPPMVLAALVTGGQLLDLCAAPGGKSAYLAETLGEAAQITAFDLTEGKLQRMVENFHRLGLAITTRAADAAAFLPEYENTADGILLDVPCSGLGLLGRKPDIRQNMDRMGMAELAGISSRILANGSRYLKVGGYLVYSTCTLNRAENQANVETFLANHPDFHLISEPLSALADSAKAQGLDQLLLENGMLTVLPGQGLDGFFLAVLLRQG